MDLDANNVVSYLRQRGLLFPEPAASAAVAVKDVSRRNRNLRVSVGATGFMVKQVRTASNEDVMMLRREATCYRMAQSDAQLARLMPSLLVYDARSNILVTKLAGDAESISDWYKRHGDLPAAFGERLGEAIGRHHARLMSAAGRAKAAPVFPGRLPFILCLREAQQANPDPIVPQLIELVRRQPGLESDLDAFAAKWRQDCLLHGDISWENVLVSSAPTEGRDLLIVDWEMADIGDAGWDVGIVLRSFLAGWIRAVQTAGEPSENAVDPAEPSFSVMRALAFAFWTGYARARGFDAAQSRSEVERGMRFAALQIAVITLGQGPFEPEVQSFAIEAARIAFNLFQHPQAPVRALLARQN